MAALQGKVAEREKSSNLSASRGRIDLLIGAGRAGFCAGSVALEEPAQSLGAFIRPSDFCEETLPSLQVRLAADEVFRPRPPKAETSDQESAKKGGSKDTSLPSATSGPTPATDLQRLKDSRSPKSCKLQRNVAGSESDGRRHRGHGAASDWRAKGK